MAFSRPPLSILHLAGNAADAETVRRFLALAAPQPAGTRFTVTQVGTLTAGLAKLADGEGFDAVLLDESLPDSDASETFAAVLRAAPRMPVVVLTASGDMEAGPRRVREGAQDYLVKSRFDAALLARALRYAVERSQLLAELDDARRQEQRERELRQLEQLAKS